MIEESMGDGVDTGGSERHSPLSKIDARLARLKVFEADLHNDEVEAAKASMKRILEPRLSWFDQKGIAVTYHGSLQYNDPKELDVDISYIAGTKLPQGEELEMEQEINNDFSVSGAWPREQCDTNFSWPSVDAIKREVQARGDSEYDPEDVEQDADRWGAYILSSPVLFASQTELLGRYQQEIRQLAGESKWLRDGIVYSLDSAIRVRMMRRQGDE
jgi:hypothetical protein